MRSVGFRQSGAEFFGCGVERLLLRRGPIWYHGEPIFGEVQPVGFHLQRMGGFGHFAAMKCVLSVFLESIGHQVAPQTCSSGLNAVRPDWFRLIIAYPQGVGAVWKLPGSS